MSSGPQLDLKELDLEGFLDSNFEELPGFPWTNSVAQAAAAEAPNVFGGLPPPTAVPVSFLRRASPTRIWRDLSSSPVQARASSLRVFEGSFAQLSEA